MITGQTLTTFAEHIVLNSLFGAAGNEYFIFFDNRIAEGITMTGQYITQKTGRHVNTKMREALKTNSNYVVYSDTDSVVGDTLVYVNGEKQTIASLFDSMNGYVKHDDVGRDYVKPVDGRTTLSFNTKTGKPEEKQISYVMKHRVKKRMYKISVDGKEVVVTEDHSVIVKRGVEYISVSPKNIVVTDILVHIV